MVEARYRAAMWEARFDGATPLYVASALLTYVGGIEELQMVTGLADAACVECRACFAASIDAFSTQHLSRFSRARFRRSFRM